MNSVNKTLYIPLYGKAYVSRKNIILQDPTAEKIWAQAAFSLKGKSKSKWLAYYMAMRAAIYDQWVEQEIKKCPKAVVLHIGCGLDSRYERISARPAVWYDIDFPEVIEERQNYFTESEEYWMLSADMRIGDWKNCIKPDQDAIIILEGVSMYFQTEELENLFKSFAAHFSSMKILMDCYTVRAAKMSKYKNPINDVGVSQVYGYDDPEELARNTTLIFEKEHSMTPKKYIEELQGLEKKIFEKLYAGKVAKSMYRMYEFRK